MATSKRSTPKTQDDRTEQLMQIVAERKQEIKDIESPKYETSMSFSYQEDNTNRVNLHTVTDVNRLLHMAGFVSNQEELFLKGLELCSGVESGSVFKWNGFTATKWIHDINARIGKIMIAKKKQDLARYEAALEQALSPQRRTERTLDAIASELGLN